jgi:Mn2+/Fe2+ NRAMP family transporter
MLEGLIAIVKIAGIATLAILGWLAWTFRNENADRREALEPADRTTRDAGGERVMRAFTAMLILGALAMLALSLVGLAGDL